MFPHFYEMLVKIGQQKEKYVFLKEEKTQVFSSLDQKYCGNNYPKAIKEVMMQKWIM